MVIVSVLVREPEANAYRTATESEIRAGIFRGGASKFTVKDAANQYLDYCDGRRQRGDRMTRAGHSSLAITVDRYGRLFKWDGEECDRRRSVELGSRVDVACILYM
jgi:hypothetical protein